MIQREQIREGMTVYSADGKKLGKVAACGTAEFQVEKGFFFPKDTILAYGDVSEVRGEDVIVTQGETALQSRYGQAEEAATTRRAAGSEPLRVPLAEEELDVTKREREAGEVRVRKTVETETKRVDVPVRKEQIRVERVAAEPTADAPARAFKEETISVPVMEEEVEVRKRPVVREEVRVAKDVSEEERRIEEPVRREEAKIEGAEENPLKRE